MRKEADLPDWPGAMRKETAAAYLELGVTTFEREVAEGNLPRGFTLGGSLHWSKAALDRHLEAIDAEPQSDWRCKAGLQSR